MRHWKHSMRNCMHSIEPSGSWCWVTGTDRFDVITQNRLWSTVFCSSGRYGHAADDSIHPHITWFGWCLVDYTLVAITPSICCVSMEESSASLCESESLSYSCDADFGLSHLFADSRQGIDKTFLLAPPTYSKWWFFRTALLIAADVDIRETITDPVLQPPHLSLQSACLIFIYPYGHGFLWNHPISLYCHSLLRNHPIIPW